MSSVLVLIAAPGSGAITREVLREVGHDPKWLSPGEACEFTHYDATVAAKLAYLPIDVNVVSLKDRRKKLLIADMDSTMIHQECIDELGDVAGVGERIKEITARAMAGQLDFEDALTERVGLLEGLDEGVIARVIENRITFRGGGKELLSTMKANGAYTALVSGGFTAFTSFVADILGFNEHHGNELLIENGKLSGQVKSPILGKEAKVDELRRICSAHGLSHADVLAVGDGANDIPMLREAGLGVALHAKPKVQEQAGYVINHGDLSALLFLQGYAKSDIK